MLVVVLKRKGVLLGGVVIEIGNARSALKKPVPGRNALSMCAAVGRMPPSLGMSHLPGSPGSAGALKRTSAR